MKRTDPTRGIDIARKGLDLMKLNKAQIEVLPDKLRVTDNVKAFVLEMAKGETVFSASKRIGIMEPYAYKLSYHPTVKRLIAEERKKYEASVQMTRKKVMDGLLEAVEMAKLMAEPATMVAGWREIAKMCGYYEPIKKDINVNVTGNVVMDRLNRLSDADLLKLITQEVSDAVEVELSNESEDE